MRIPKMIAAIQVYIKQVTDKDVDINPNMGIRDFAKLSKLYGIAQTWLNNNNAITRTL